MMDEGKIAMRPAVELSYLSEQEQSDLLEAISYQDATPSLAQTIKMRQFSKEGKNKKPEWDAAGYLGGERRRIMHTLREKRTRRGQ